MNKIYCFINGGDDFLLSVLALAEDGNVLAGHASSNEYWAKHDIGINSDWKHEKYKEHFPDGYELIWLDEPLSDEGFKKALALAEKQNAELETTECEECGGSGFSKAGTGYDAVCDNCGGQGVLPK